MGYIAGWRELITADTREDVRPRINEWNTKIHDFAKKFQKRHKDGLVALYDTSRIFNAVLDNPTKYGFKDGFSECQDDDCLWNDDLHPAFGMHKILAADLTTFLESI
jgi:phospholipase/lecithinase/hemolysin